MEFTASKREARALIYEGHKYVTISEDRVTGFWRDVERVETAIDYITKIDNSSMRSL